MAITYGMSVRMFWESDPDLFWAYRFSYFEAMKLNNEIQNYNAWLQGAYFYEAVSVALCNSFSKSHMKYSSMPYGKNEDKKIDVNVQVADLKARISQVNKIKQKVKKVGEKNE